MDKKVLFFDKTNLLFTGYDSHYHRIPVNERTGYPLKQILSRIFSCTLHQSSSRLFAFWVIFDLWHSEKT